MRKTSPRPLIALNAGLLAALGTICLWPGTAHSRQPAQRTRGEFTMVAGKTNSGTAQAVYIVDSVNQELLGLTWDRSRQTLGPVGFRSLDADTRQEPGR